MYSRVAMRASAAQKISSVVASSAGVRARGPPVGDGQAVMHVEVQAQRSDKWLVAGEPLRGRREVRTAQCCEDRRRKHLDRDGSADLDREVAFTGGAGFGVECLPEPVVLRDRQLDGPAGEDVGR